LDWVKPHAGGGLGVKIPIIQYKKNHSNTSSPAIPTLATTDIEIGAKLREEWIRHTLGEDVGKLRSRRDVQNANFLNDDLVTDEVEINLDMLNRVGRK
jgi:hypothetical protein